LEGSLPPPHYDPHVTLMVLTTNKSHLANFQRKQYNITNRQP